MKYLESDVMLASFPGPRPASRCLQYSKAGGGYRFTVLDRKLGKGLGTKQWSGHMCTISQILLPYMAFQLSGERQTMD